MATALAPNEPIAIPAARRRSLIVPREHGAWGILLVPLVVGAAVGLGAGGRGWDLVPLTLAALGLFWLRTPVESWMGAVPVRARTATELQAVQKAAILLSLGSFGTLLLLFWGGRNTGLLQIGFVSAIAFSVQAVLKKVWRGARSAAQMIGSAGLTATAPAAYYVVTGHLDPTAWSLWAANFLFAANQIQFVQMRIHAAKITSRRAKFSAGAWFLSGQIALILLLGVACSRHHFPWYAALAFLPILYRGFAWFAAQAEALAVHALGKSELAYSCVFGLLLAVAMRLR
jgi:hypothetical protein